MHLPELRDGRVTSVAVLSCGGAASIGSSDHRAVTKGMLMKRREANWMSVANAASGGIGSCAALSRRSVCFVTSPCSYDAIIDPHCRRSVENHSLKHLLAQTRPEAQVSAPTKTKG